jgi:hypothetical protein
MNKKGFESLIFFVFHFQEKSNQWDYNKKIVGFIFIFLFFHMK